MYSTDGWLQGQSLTGTEKFMGRQLFRAVSFMEEHQEEVHAAGGRCCWYVMNKMYGRSERDRYILARSLNDEKMQHVGFLYMVMSDSLVQDAFAQLQSDEAVRISQTRREGFSTVPIRNWIRII